MLAVLLAVAAGAGGLSTWGSTRRQLQQTDREASRWLIRADRGDVAAFSIEQPGQSAVTLVRAGRGWRMTAPILGLADAKAAEDQVARMSRMMATPVVGAPSQEELVRFGLVPERGRLELYMANGSRRALAVGAKSPFHGGTYVRDDAGSVFLVDAPVDTWIGSEVSGFRERRLLGAEVADVRSVVIRTSSVECTVTRDRNLWVRNDAALDSGVVHGALSLLAATRIQAFVEPSESSDEYGLESPRLILHVQLADGVRRSLTLSTSARRGGGAASPPYYARRDGSLQDVGLLLDAIAPQLEPAFERLCGSFERSSRSIGVAGPD